MAGYEFDVEVEGGPPEVLPSTDGASPVNCDQSCPVCAASLLDMSSGDIQTHVNICIDSLTSRPPPPAPKSRPSTPKPLRPLSSLQTPHPPSCTPGAKGKGKAKADANAFSMLMSSHKENEAWKEADAVEDRSFRPTKGNGGRRKAPFFKVMQGMPIAVDAFRYGAIPGVNAYFLTHAHSDHYTNLSSSWKTGPIYCSECTGKLIIHLLGVDPKWVHPLPFDVATTIPDTGGVRVIPIEANHCPGSCLFLFEGPQTADAGDSQFKSPFVGSPRTFRYLHCGDFRASPRHTNHPAVKGKRMDIIYLDTTYLDPKYCFPPQPQVISACAELAKRIVNGNSTGKQGSPKDGSMDGWLTAKPKEQATQPPRRVERTLFVVGTYSIGKERIVKAIARALGSKVYCDARKAAILRCETDPELHALLTADPLGASVHLVPLGCVNSDKLPAYVARWGGAFARAVGFRPTGWTYTPPAGTDPAPTLAHTLARAQGRPFDHTQLRPMRGASRELVMYGVPYSEHSSFFELTAFALSVDWARIVATVNVGSEASRGKMGRWIEKWEAEGRKRRKEGKGGVEPRNLDYW